MNILASTTSFYEILPSLIHYHLICHLCGLSSESLSSVHLNSNFSLRFFFYMAIMTKMASRRLIPIHRRITKKRLNYQNDFGWRTNLTLHFILSFRDFSPREKSCQSSYIPLKLFHWSFSLRTEQEISHWWCWLSSYPERGRFTPRLCKFTCIREEIRSVCTTIFRSCRPTVNCHDEQTTIPESPRHALAETFVTRDGRVRTLRSDVRQLTILNWLRWNPTAGRISRRPDSRITVPWRRWRLSRNTRTHLSSDSRQVLMTRPNYKQSNLTQLCEETSRIISVNRKASVSSFLPLHRQFS